MKTKLSVMLFSFAVAACGRGDRPAELNHEVPQAAAVASDAQIQVKANVAVTAPASAPAVEVTPVAPPVSPSNYDDALAQGKDLAAKGDHTRARELFEAAARLDHKRAEPHIELARLFITTGDRGLAVAAGNKAVKLAPTSSRAWNTKGRADLAAFAYDNAVESFTKAVELDRDNVWAWNNLGFAELQLKKYGDAVEHFTEATNRKGATGYMWNNLGVALEQLDRLDEARAAFDKGGQLGSSDAMASRKRLEGVKTIAIVTDVREDKTPVTVPDVGSGNGIGDGSGSGSGSGIGVGSGVGSGSGIGDGGGSGSGTDTGTESSDHATN